MGSFLGTDKGPQLINDYALVGDLCEEVPRNFLILETFALKISIYTLFEAASKDFC